jgi:lysozyme
MGDTAFRSSTLLRLLNQGQYDQVPAQLRRWNMDSGHVVQGLVNRRNKEIDLWNTPV